MIEKTLHNFEQNSYK